jgi:protease I
MAGTYRSRSRDQLCNARWLAGCSGPHHGHRQGARPARDANGRHAYARMAQSAAFQEPLRYSDIRSTDFDALLLPGGHAKGMRPYLESAILQKQIAEFFAANKPIAAICHGVLLAARSNNAAGQSVLYGRKTTALLARWP